MKKQLLAAALAFSITAVSGNASAFVISNGVMDEYGNFTFYDSRLNSGSSGFASLTSDGAGAFRFTTYINTNNSNNFSHSYNQYAQVSYSFDKRDSVENPDKTFTYERNGRFYTEPGFATSGFALQTAYAYDNGSRKEVSLETNLFANNGAPIGHDRRGFISDGEGDRYWQSGFSGESTDPFDVSELESRIWGDYPTAGYGIFNFHNSFVNYNDGSRQSFADIIGTGGLGSDFTFVNPNFAFNFVNGNIDIMWGDLSAYMDDSGSVFAAYNFDVKTVTGVTLAYAPVPEPETWAMLLAGLGIVGAVTRRRQQRN
jgi:hypothetical protein